MPLDVLPYQQQFEKFGFIPSNHEKPNWFPVKIGEIYDDRGRAIPGHRRVYNADSGDNLAVHSESYKLIPYETSFAAFDRALGVSGLNLDNLHVCTDLTHNGARCFRQYILPAHEVDIGDGDKSVLRIIMFNSYDGSTRFGGMAGGYRFVCANMSVIGTDLVRIGMKHIGKTSEEKIEATISNLVASAAKAMKRMEQMREWLKISIGADQIQKVMESFPQGSDTLTNNIITNFSVSNYSTLWDLYNVLTAWSTHTESKSNHAATRAHREQRVGQFIECDKWKVLESA